MNSQGTIGGPSLLPPPPPPRTSWGHQCVAPHCPSARSHLGAACGVLNRGGAQSGFWAKAGSAPQRGPSLAHACGCPEVLVALQSRQLALGEHEKCCAPTLSKALPQGRSLRSSSLRPSSPLLRISSSPWRSVGWSRTTAPLPWGKTHHCRTEKQGVAEVPSGPGSFPARTIVGSDVSSQPRLTAWAV